MSRFGNRFRHNPEGDRTSEAQSAFRSCPGCLALAATGGTCDVCGRNWLLGTLQSPGSEASENDALDAIWEIADYRGEPMSDTERVSRIRDLARRPRSETL